MSSTRAHAAAVALALAAACGPSPSSEVVIFSGPLDSTDALISTTGASADRESSHDGGGSVRVDAGGPTTLRIAEVTPPDLEDTTLFYRAHLRAQDLEGQAYLEMWVRVPGRGEFFSRALHQPLSGTSDWISQQTPFRLEAGQRADLVRLNLAIDGKGTVWIDDLELTRSD